MAGIAKYIESPDVMWNLFLQYEKATKESHFKVHDYVGKDAIEVYREKERCLTIEGFEEFVCDHPDTKFNTTDPDLSDYFENKSNRYADFVPICSRIKRRIRKDQIEGGMAGIYNPSITQRLQGLVEKSEVKQESNHRFDLSEMSDEEKQMFFELSMKVKDGN